MARVRVAYPESTLFCCELPVRITDLNYGDHLGHDVVGEEGKQNPRDNV